ncbi:hypothetical protein [Actinocatenispora rupis]|uniref:Uncharacterized protein n=1 Tax=Actinocatenispora rupis TaxID=519421 RepID=A0A8J3IZK7_9ACTN|nr:hypothetical protein [Actinocatenispora rupis]GID11483.1 hypothetical protein Aru02nite_23720 [Actinocatenispora rupis]
MARRYQSTPGFRIYSLVVLLIVALGLLGVGGYYATTNNVTCDGKQMYPGDTCFSKGQARGYQEQAAAHQSSGRTVMLFSLVPFAFAALSAVDVVRHGDITLPRRRARSPRRAVAPKRSGRPRGSDRPNAISRLSRRVAARRLETRVERLKAQRELLKPEYDRARKYASDPEKAPANRDAILRRWDRIEADLAAARRRLSAAARATRS